ncbi:NAD(P)/FAD-dependent oxidoreductase [Microbacterium sp. LWH7-1.2]|uniref:flavin-containing monooxygenase n=1 Tax=Microbacterium sp. LWH7-1.2 TaxID=3135257 RepID=UPI003139063A
MTERTPRVAVIGAGFSGIAVAVELIDAGFEDVVVFDEADGIGGTWWHNSYPGAEVDTPSILYSFSYAPEAWSRNFVQRDELQAYLARVADRFGVTERTRFNTKVRSATWNADRHSYTLELFDGSREEFEFVVSAVGFLNVPNLPTWPGLDEFEGPVLHSARWDSGVDLTGRAVAVVGSGSTAAQLVPGIADTVESLLMFQREPGWVLPKNSRPLTEEERLAAGSPIVQRIVRSNMLWRREKVQHGLRLLKPGTKANRAAESNARKFIGTVFADRPDLAEAVTPKYPFGGKRPIMADDLYPALLLPNVKLVPRAVERITRSGVVDSSGEHHDVDVLVLSTGFDTRYITTLDVYGADGRSLQQAWNGEPEALLGVLTPGFPNFFMMYGPLTNGGAVASMLEEQAKYVGAAIKAVVREDADHIEVRPQAVVRFNEIIQGRLAGSAFYDASNYYKSPSGKVVTQWSDGVGYYIFMSRRWRRRAWTLARDTNKRARPRWARPRPRGLRRLDLWPGILHPVRTYRWVKELQQTDRGNAFAAGRAGNVEKVEIGTIV